MAKKSRRKSRKATRTYGIVRTFGLLGLAKLAMPNTMTEIGRFNVMNAVENAGSELGTIKSRGSVLLGAGIGLMGLQYIANRFKSSNPRVKVGNRKAVALL